MRIGVNLLPFRAQLAGAGRYTQNILRELVRGEGADEYVFFVAPRAAAQFDYGTPNVTQVIVNLPESMMARIAYEQGMLPRQLAKYNCDALFTPSVAIPVMGRARKSVTVIYDMIAEHRSNSADATQPRVVKYPPLRNAYVRWMSRYAARHSDALITISENSRREIAQYAGVPLEKIHLAPPGVDASLHPITDPKVLRRVSETYHLPERFILYVGTLEPGKNLQRLVQAYARLKRTHAKLEQHLVLAGAQGWGVAELEREIQQSDASGFHLIGFVPQEDLAALYSLADVFVYPSLYEGFGMPPLEAMACGTPVIVSNVSSLPEVVGNAWAGPTTNAGLLVSPYDVEGMAEAMARVLQDTALHAQLYTAGLARAQQFRWDASAEVIRKTIFDL